MKFSACPALTRGQVVVIAVLGALWSVAATSASAQTPSVGGAASAPASPSLHYFSTEPTQSGAATFNLGDRFSGPGVVTVGWMGAKKQLPLPPGEWVALAIVDHPGHDAAEQMTTVDFGRFEGDRLVELLAFTQTRTAAPRNAHWNDVDVCAAGAAHPAYLWSSPSYALTSECAEVLTVPQAPAEQDVGASALQQSLTRLGAQAGGPAVEARLYLADARHGYLRVEHVDWRGHGDAAAVTPEVDWLQHYRPRAEAGFQRSIDESDLKPIATPAAG